MLVAPVAPVVNTGNVLFFEGLTNKIAKGELLTKLLLMSKAELENSKTAEMIRQAGFKNDKEAIDEIKRIKESIQTAFNRTAPVQWNTLAYIPKDAAPGVASARTIENFTKALIEGWNLGVNTPAGLPIDFTLYTKLKSNLDNTDEIVRTRTLGLENQIRQQSAQIHTFDETITTNYKKIAELNQLKSELAKIRQNLATIDARTIANPGPIALNSPAVVYPNAINALTKLFDRFENAEVQNLRVEIIEEFQNGAGTAALPVARIIANLTGRITNITNTEIAPANNTIANTTTQRTNTLAAKATIEAELQNLKQNGLTKTVDFGGGFLFDLQFKPEEHGVGGAIETKTICNWFAPDSNFNATSLETIQGVVVRDAAPGAALLPLKAAKTVIENEGLATTVNGLTIKTNGERLNPAQIDIAQENFSSQKPFQDFNAATGSGKTTAAARIRPDIVTAGNEQSIAALVKEFDRTAGIKVAVIDNLGGIPVGGSSEAIAVQAFVNAKKTFSENIENDIKECDRLIIETEGLPAELLHAGHLTCTDVEINPLFPAVPGLNGYPINTEFTARKNDTIAKLQAYKQQLLAAREIAKNSTSLKQYKDKNIELFNSKSAIGESLYSILTLEMNVRDKIRASNAALTAAAGIFANDAIAPNAEFAAIFNEINNDPTGNWGDILSLNAGHQINANNIPGRQNTVNFIINNQDFINKIIENLGESLQTDPAAGLLDANRMVKTGVPPKYQIFEDLKTYVQAGCVGNFNPQISPVHSNSSDEAKKQICHNFFNIIRSLDIIKRNQPNLDLNNPDFIKVMKNVMSFSASSNVHPSKFMNSNEGMAYTYKNPELIQRLQGFDGITNANQFATLPYLFDEISSHLQAQQAQEAQKLGEVNAEYPRLIQANEPNFEINNARFDGVNISADTNAIFGAAGNETTDLAASQIEEKLKLAGRIENSDKTVAITLKAYIDAVNAGTIQIKAGTTIYSDEWDSIVHTEAGVACPADKVTSKDFAYFLQKIKISEAKITLASATGQDKLQEVKNDLIVNTMDEIALGALHGDGLVFEGFDVATQARQEIQNSFNEIEYTDKQRIEEKKTVDAKLQIRSTDNKNKQIEEIMDFMTPEYAIKKTKIDGELKDKEVFLILKHLNARDFGVGAVGGGGDPFFDITNPGLDLEAKRKLEKALKKLNHIAEQYEFAAPHMNGHQALQAYLTKESMLVGDAEKIGDLEPVRLKQIQALQNDLNHFVVADDIQFQGSQDNMYYSKEEGQLLIKFHEYFREQVINDGHAHLDIEGYIAVLPIAGSAIRIKFNEFLNDPKSTPEAQRLKLARLKEKALRDKFTLQTFYKQPAVDFDALDFEPAANGKLSDQTIARVNQLRVLLNSRAPEYTGTTLLLDPAKLMAESNPFDPVSVKDILLGKDEGKFMECALSGDYNPLVEKETKQINDFIAKLQVKVNEKAERVGAFVGIDQNVRYGVAPANIHTIPEAIATLNASFGMLNGLAANMKNPANFAAALNAPVAGGPTMKQSLEQSMTTCIDIIGQLEAKVNALKNNKNENATIASIKDSLDKFKNMKKVYQELLGAAQAADNTVAANAFIKTIKTNSKFIAEPAKFTTPIQTFLTQQLAKFNEGKAVGQGENHAKLMYEEGVDNWKQEINHIINTCNTEAELNNYLTRVGDFKANCNTLDKFFKNKRSMYNTDLISFETKEAYYKDYMKHINICEEMARKKLAAFADVDLKNDLNAAFEEKMNKIGNKKIHLTEADNQITKDALFGVSPFVKITADQLGDGFPARVTEIEAGLNNMQPFARMMLVYNVRRKAQTQFVNLVNENIVNSALANDIKEKITRVEIDRMCNLHGFNIDLIEQKIKEKWKLDAMFAFNYPNKEDIKMRFAMSEVMDYGTYFDRSLGNAVDRTALIKSFSLAGEHENTKSIGDALDNGAYTPITYMENHALGLSNKLIGNITVVADHTNLADMKQNLGRDKRHGNVANDVTTRTSKDKVIYTGNEELAIKTDVRSYYRDQVAKPIIASEASTNLSASRVAVEVHEVPAGYDIAGKKSKIKKRDPIFSKKNFGKFGGRFSEA